MERLSYTFDSAIDPVSLAEDWRHLHTQAQENFFLSWPWISTWIEKFQPNLILLRITLRQSLVGLGLFNSRRYKKFGVLPREQWRLHQMGNEKEDQIWIEHNALLCVPQYQEQIHTELTQRIDESNRLWDELVFSGVSQTLFQCITSSSKAYFRELWRAPTYTVDLLAIKNKYPDYLSSLSRNTRYQINRALKAWHALGQVELIRASSEEQRNTFFDFAKKQHKAKWGILQSGFYNDAFSSFHKNLVRNYGPSDQIDLLALTLEGTPVAVLYNFKIHHKVYFYLSGIDYSREPKLKPGLVVHALAIQYYMDQGFHVYDFLGGAAQYKASLGEKTEDIVGVEIIRPTLISWFECQARKIKALGASKHSTNVNGNVT